MNAQDLVVSGLAQGLQELKNQLRYGQYHLPMGVDGLAIAGCGCGYYEIKIR